MHKPLVFLASLLIVSAAFAAPPRSDDTVFPTRAKDQSRPQIHRVKALDDDCTITHTCEFYQDPGDPNSSGGGIHRLCTTSSTGTKTTQSVCRRDNTGTYYVCVAVPDTRACDLWTDRSGLPLDCATCVQ